MDSDPQLDSRLLIRSAGIFGSVIVYFLLMALLLAGALRIVQDLEEIKQALRDDTLQTIEAMPKCAPLPAACPPDDSETVPAPDLQ